MVAYVRHLATIRSHPHLPVEAFTPEPTARAADPYGDWAAVYRAETETDGPSPWVTARMRQMHYMATSWVDKNLCAG